MRFRGEWINSSPHLFAQSCPGKTLMGWNSSLQPLILLLSLLAYLHWVVRTLLKNIYLFVESKRLYTTECDSATLGPGATPDTPGSGVARDSFSVLGNCGSEQYGQSVPALCGSPSRGGGQRAERQNSSRRDNTSWQPHSGPTNQAAVMRNQKPVTKIFFLVSTQSQPTSNQDIFSGVNKCCRSPVTTQ